MKCERFAWLREKEVINICDGKRLGRTQDLEIDIVTGKVCSLIIPEESGKWNLFCKEQVYIVPWRCIKQIGDDIILVELNSEEVLIENE